MKGGVEMRGGPEKKWLPNVCSKEESAIVVYYSSPYINLLFVNEWQHKQ